MITRQPLHLAASRRVGQRRVTVLNLITRRSGGLQIRSISSSAEDKVDIDSLLAKPSWSVETLLLDEESTDGQRHIEPKQLHHLLRLSALPPPKDADEESKMLSTLSAQLHFVRNIQKVDTTGVAPLQSLRDETEAGRKDSTIDLEQLREAFAQEEIKGDYHKRIRRRQHESTTATKADEWDVLGHAEKKVGRYFVVEGGKEW